MQAWECLRSNWITPSVYVVLLLAMAREVRLRFETLAARITREHLGGPMAISPFWLEHGMID